MHVRSRVYLCIYVCVRQGERPFQCQRQCHAMPMFVCCCGFQSPCLSVCLNMCMYVCMYAFYYESIMHAVISLLRNRSTCAYVCIHMRTFYAELYMYTLIFTETHTPHVLTVYAVAAVRRFDTTEPSYYSPTVIYCRRQADVGEVQSWG